LVFPDQDGSNEWHSLTDNVPGTRQELLHNIDPSGQGHMGLRVGDYKLLVGDAGMAWSDWYPPWTQPDDARQLHVNNSEAFKLHGTEREFTHFRDIAAHLVNKFRNDSQLFKNVGMRMVNSEPFKLKKYLQEIKLRKALSDIQEIPKTSQKSYFHSNQPVKVECGPKPFNASTNCDPRVAPCLFNIAQDPCEYHNIAQQHSGLVVQMLTRLLQYEDTMVPPLNKDVDPAGNPKYHNGTWVPWVIL